MANVDDSPPEESPGRDQRPAQAQDVGASAGDTDASSPAPESRSTERAAKRKSALSAFKNVLHFFLRSAMVRNFEFLSSLSEAEKERLEPVVTKFAAEVGKLQLAATIRLLVTMVLLAVSLVAAWMYVPARMVGASWPSFWVGIAVRVVTVVLALVFLFLLPRTGGWFNPEPRSRTLLWWSAVPVSTGGGLMLTADRLPFLGGVLGIEELGTLGAALVCVPIGYWGFILTVAVLAEQADRIVAGKHPEALLASRLLDVLDVVGSPDRWRLVRFRLGAVHSLEGAARDVQRIYRRYRCGDAYVRHVWAARADSAALALRLWKVRFIAPRPGDRERAVDAFTRYLVGVLDGNLDVLPGAKRHRRVIRPWRVVVSALRTTAIAVVPIVTVLALLQHPILTDAHVARLALWTAGGWAVLTVLVTLDPRIPERIRLLLSAKDLGRS